MKTDTRLIAPTPTLEKEFRDMLSDWHNAGETAAPYVQEEKTADFEAYVNELLGFSNGLGLPGSYVPYSTFWLVDAHNRVLGLVSIRHRLNERLRQEGGHIGYTIRPSERGKGHATRLLALALAEAKSLGIERALLTCDKTNLASRRVILANGGVLSGESVVNGKEKFIFWIEV
jgi:predicted acetyltransferase